MNELYHHGVKGQKWGIRRYQNEDGTLNAKGMKRYASKIGDKGARRYIADRAHYETMTNRKLNKEKKFYKAGVGGLVATTGALVGRELGKRSSLYRGKTVGTVLGALAGYTVGSSLMEMSARGGSWLGSRIGAAAADQRYVDIANSQILSGGKVGNLRELEREYNRRYRN